MSVEDYGVYGLFVTTVTLASIIGAMGLQESLAFLIGRSAEKAPQYFASAIIYIFLPLGLTSTLAASFWLSFSTIFVFYIWITPALMAVCGRIMLFISQGGHLGVGNIKSFNLSETLPVILLFIGAAVVYPFGKLSVVYFLWIYGVAHFTIGLWYLLNSVVKTAQPFKPELTCAVEVLKQGAPYALSMFLAVANNTLALYILNAKGMENMTGYFFIAWQIFNALLNVANALGLVLFSHSARAKDPQAILKSVSRYTSLLLWFMMGVGSAAALFSPWIVPFVFGADYVDAVPFIQLIMLCMGFVSLTRVMYRTLGGVGLSYAGTAILFPALVLNGLCSWFLIDYFGAIGAVQGLIISQIFTISCYLALVWMKFKLPFYMFIIPNKSDIFGALNSIHKISMKFINTILKKA
ncbi:MAG: hypothetical protein ACRBDI_06710 [Alphaproteobacteria bacterium]